MESKRLVKGEKKLAGVCSGIANYFGVDPTIIRLLCTLSVLCCGCGLLAYVVLAFLMPEE